MPTASAPRAPHPPRRRRRARGLAPKETILFIVALMMPLVALMMLFNNVRGSFGDLLGTGPNLADRRLIEQRRLQLTGSVSDKPPPLLDLSFVSTGLWAGRASAPAQPDDAADAEMHVAAPGAKAPGAATSATAPKGEPRAGPGSPAAERESPAKKAVFEVEAGATLAQGPVPVARLDVSAAPSKPCAPAQGPCDCGGRGAGAAGVAGTAAGALLRAGAATLLGAGAEPGEGRSVRCACGPAGKAVDDPAYLALGFGDRFFEDEGDRETDAARPARRRLLDRVARSPLTLWKRLAPRAKGVKRWELLRVGDYVLVRQTSRISTDYDGAALPPQGLWDERYKPETAFTVVNRDPSRTTVQFKDPATRKRQERALASSDARAWDFNKRDLYAERKAEVGARVSLSARDRYVVVNQALDEELAREFGVKWGEQQGAHRPALGSTALVSDPRSGVSQVAVVADLVGRDACCQVSAGLREVFAETLKIGGALEDREDAVDTLYLVHDPAKGGSPVADTSQLADLDDLADRQAADVLPALDRLIAASGGR